MARPTWIAVPLAWLATTVAVVATWLLGRRPGYTRNFGEFRSHDVGCVWPPLPAAHPHEDAVAVAALISLFLLLAALVAAALRLRRWPVVLAAGQMTVSLGLFSLSFEEGWKYNEQRPACDWITGTHLAVDVFRTSLLVAVVAGPVLLLLVAIMRLRLPRPDPPLPPASVRRRLWDLLR